MIHFIGGEEPYLIDRAKDKYIKELTQPEFNYCSADALTEEIVQFLYTVPVFDEKKVAYIVVDDISVMDIPLFDDLCELDNLLIVRFRKHDARKTFFRKLKEKNMVSVYTKEDGEKELVTLIPAYLKKLHVCMKKDAYTAFLERENYKDSPEASIYTLMDDIKALSITAKNCEITMEDVVSTVEDRSKGNAFSLAAYIKDKDISALSKQACLLSGNEIPTLSALLREYRIAYKAKYFSYKDIGIGKCLFSYMDKDELTKGIRILTDTIRGFKAGSVPTDTTLLSCFVQLV